MVVGPVGGHEGGRYRVEVVETNWDVGRVRQLGECEVVHPRWSLFT